MLLMSARVSPKRRILGAVALILCCAAIFGAYRRLLERPGETALHQIVAEDALLVVTVDLRPSSLEQLQVSRRLQNALQKEGLEQRFSDTLDEITEKNKMVDLVKPYLSGGGALAVWQPHGTTQNWWDMTSSHGEGGDSDVVVALSVSNPGKVADILRTESERMTEQEGLSIAHLRRPLEGFGTVIGNYLVLAPSSNSLRRSWDVYQGRKPSFSSRKEFAPIRASFPADANLLAFAAPNAFPQGLNEGDSSPEARALSELRHIGGAAFSVSFHKEGIVWDGAVDWNAKSLKPLQEAAPLDTRLATRIPAGFWGVFAVSQPGKWYSVWDEYIKDLPEETQDSWREAKRNMERETKLNLADDVVPAFNGNAVVAVYPSQKPSQPVEGLLVVDDARGANPAQLAEALREWVERQDSHVQIKSGDKSGATFFSVPASLLDSTGRGAHEENSRTQAVYAKVGNAVLAATSEELLNDAVAVYQGRTKSATINAPILPGAQAMLVADLKEILTSKAASQVIDSEPGHEKTRDALLNAISDKQFVLSTRYQNDRAVCSSLLPVRYEEAIHLIAVAMDESKEQEKEEVRKQHGAD